MDVIDAKQNRPQNETFLWGLSANVDEVGSAKERKPYCSPRKQFFFFKIWFFRILNILLQTHVVLQISFEV